MATLFISDLHLEANRPDIGGQFLRFLHEEARGADALYILGDLFEAWIGDDDPEPSRAAVVAGIRELSRSGVPCFFMRGNRDFLIGEGFAAASGCRLLEDPTVIDCHGSRLLLMHGDTLCTDDVEYQAVRRQVRDPAWQRGVLALPLEQRRAMAGEARAASREHNRSQPPQIMDVNDDAVAAAMREHEVSLLLHGHTHRPDVHRFEVDGSPCTRIVLGAWYEHGSVVRWSDGGFSLDTLPRDEAHHR